MKGSKKVDNKKEEEFYFEECKRFFDSLRQEIEWMKSQNYNENGDSKLPFWVSQR